MKCYLSILQNKYSGGIKAYNMPFDAFKWII